MAAYAEGLRTGVMLEEEYVEAAPCVRDVRAALTRQLPG